jgi:tetratricopeptide (TPR) repeat protein
MRSIRKAFKNWLSDKNALGLIAILSAADDPLTALQAHHRHIDERVIEELVVYSYYLAKTENIEKGLVWAEVARQASLVGGGAKEYADCLDLRASLLEQLFDEKSKVTSEVETDNERVLLAEALECATEALRVYQKANLTESLPVAYGRLSVLHRAMGNSFPAFEARLSSVVGWIELPDVAQAMPTLVSDLRGLFWSLRRGELTRGAELLLQNTNALEKTTRWLDMQGRARLFDMFGGAYGELEQANNALLWWDRAVAQCREVNAREDEFTVWSHLQDYAYHSGDPEKMVNYGNECVAVAPEGVESWRLAYRYRLLAFANKMLERNTDAIPAYHRAAELYSFDKETNSNAGECFLEAGILEEEMGLIDEAQDDLEKVLEFSGGARTFWLTYLTLAKLFWKRRGDLGRALDYADMAVERSIGMQLGFAERAVSHHLSGILHQSSGNIEESLDRFEALLKILEENSKKGGFYIGRLEWHEIVPPSKSEAVLLAMWAAAKLDREAEAQRYLKLFQSLASQTADEEFSDEEKALLDEDVDTANFLRGVSLLAQGDRLLLFDPKQAMAMLETSMPLLGDFAPGLIVANRDLGLIRLRLEEFDAARAYFERALQLIAQSPDIFEEIICRLNLGVAEAGCQNVQAAYEQISRVIQIKEAERTSLANDEQRFAFLQNTLDTYLMFLGICMKLRLFREALETVEKIKSRVLLDLVSQSNKRPIDYRSLSRIKELGRRRKDWMDDVLLETGASMSDRLDRLMEADSEKATAWIYTPVKIYEEIDASKRELKERNLMLEMETRSSSPLSFDDIRELIALRT